MTRKALGKGLRALIPDAGELEALETRQLPVEQVYPSRFQPRREFKDESLDELAESIRAHGVLEPLIVRPVGDSYELVVGERRWRAAGRAGLETVPAIVRQMDDQEVLAVALIENLQREGLNPIEEASGYRRLMDAFSLTQEEVAAEVGRRRSSVANSLRLLSLEEDVQGALGRGDITTGHAKALLGIEDRNKRQRVFRRVLSEGLTVRQAEELARRSTRMSGVHKARAQARTSDPSLRAVEERIEAVLGTKVRVVPRRRGAGKIEIEYYSDEDVNRIVDMVTGMGA